MGRPAINAVPIMGPGAGIGAAAGAPAGGTATGAEPPLPTDMGATPTIVPLSRLGTAD
jgi:hypothetical protein